MNRKEISKRKKKAVSSVITAVLLVGIAVVAVILVYNIIMITIGSEGIGSGFDRFLKELGFLGEGGITGYSILEQPACYILLEINETRADSGIEFTLLNVTNLYGLYGWFVPPYNESDSYVLRTYDQAGEEIANFSFNTGLIDYYWYDSSDESIFEYDSSDESIFEYDSETDYIIIPNDNRISSIKIINNTHNIQITDLNINLNDIRCEKNCKAENEQGNYLNDECCYGFFPFAMDENSFTCTKCGDGVCSEHETWETCYADCESQLNCEDYEIKSPEGCISPSPVMDGLIAYYNFDGNVKNIMTGNIPENSGISFEDSVFDKSGKFNNGYIDEANDGLGTGDFSISFWIKTGQKDGIVYSEKDDDQNSVKIWIENGELKFSSGDCSDYMIAENIDDNRWHYVAVARSAELRIYIDGIERYNEEFDCPVNLHAERVSVGAEADSCYLLFTCHSNYFEGSMEDLMFFDRSLDYSEVGKLYSYGIYLTELEEELSQFDEDIYYKLCTDSDCNKLTSLFELNSKAYIKAFGIEDAELRGTLTLPDGSSQELSFECEGFLSFLFGSKPCDIVELTLTEIGEYNAQITASKEGYIDDVVDISFEVVENLLEISSCNKNNVCDDNEDYESCPEDCGEISAPPPPVSVDYYIDSCTTLSERGKVYALDRDIYLTGGASYCIKITAPDITLDCQGHSITSENDAAGVYSNQLRTTIKNCKISVGIENCMPYCSGDNSKGIYLEGADNSQIFNNELNGKYLDGGWGSEGQWTGLHLKNTNYTRIENNIASGNVMYGIWLESSSNNILVGNTAKSNGYYGVYLLDDSKNNLISDSLLENNKEGIRLQWSHAYIPKPSTNVFNNNQACDNRDFDINLICGESTGNSGQGNIFGSVQYCDGGGLSYESC